MVFFQAYERCNSVYLPADYVTRALDIAQAGDAQDERDAATAFAAAYVAEHALGGEKACHPAAKANKVASKAAVLAHCTRVRPHRSPAAMPPCMAPSRVRIHRTRRAHACRLGPDGADGRFGRLPPRARDPL